MNVDATGIAADPPSRTVHPAGATVTETVHETTSEYWAAYCPTCGADHYGLDRLTAVGSATRCCINEETTTP